MSFSRKEETIGINVLTINGTNLEPKQVSKEKYENFIGGKKCFLHFPENMEEFQLKGYLRDRGYIPSQYEAYNESRLFFAEAFEEEFIEIATQDILYGRTLKELNANEDSILVVLAAYEKVQCMDVWYG